MDDLPDDVIVPDFAEPVTGYRVWIPVNYTVPNKSDHEGEALPPIGPACMRAINGTVYPWRETTVLEAECRMPSGAFQRWANPAYGATQTEPCTDPPCPPFKTGYPNPHYGHGCGIYAAKTFEDLATVWLMDSEKASNYIVGEVLLWGKVYEYDKGWRGQYAQPSVLYDNGRPEVAELARRYGCEVRPFDRKRFRAALRTVYEEEAERIRKAQAWVDLAEQIRQAADASAQRARRWLTAVRGLHYLAGAFCLAAAFFYAVTDTWPLAPAWGVLAAVQAWAARVWKGVL